MRVIDWRQLLSERRVPFVEKGPNVKRGEINIQCPFCGSADPSHHMGLNLESGFWACWRNSAHRGKSPLRLLTRLLDISYTAARELAGLGTDYVDPDGFDAVAARVMGRDKRVERMEQVKREFLAFPREFLWLLDSRAHTDYMIHERRFSAWDMEVLEEQYHIKAARTGDQRGRVIFPYYMHGELVAWTGRAITPRAMIRYKDLPLEECLVPIKETVYNHDGALDGGKVLVVGEGPMDALKIDVYGRSRGVRAVALSTNTVSEQQTLVLQELSTRFNRTYIMLDNVSGFGKVDGMRMKQQLSRMKNLSIIGVPYGLKDAAEMQPEQAKHFAINLGAKK